VRDIVVTDDQDESRFDKGMRHHQEVWGAQYKRPSVYEKLDPDVYRLVVEFCHGDVLSRPGLDIKTRELLIIGTLITQGRAPELRTHINGALNVGVTRQEIVETILQLGVYSGFPNMHAATVVAVEVFEERGI
jgi:4-carboxymuconolactone decarboxylase